MAKYQYCEDPDGNTVGVKNTETGTVIPNENKGWQQREYEEWLSEGNTPDPAYTEEERTEMALNEQITGLKTQVKKADITLFKLIIALFQVGVSKGIWTSADFDADLVSTATTIKQRLDELDALGGE